MSLPSDVLSSPLYSEDMAPVPPEKRTWQKWDLAALWVGMAVCIPTYLLASYMMRSGLSWQMALLIIGLANVVITIPMALNGDAGVRYGIPFPVIGRAAFGIRGIHLASLVRGFVACGWFGVQTWIGGLAFYSIWNVLTGSEGVVGLSVGKFLAFALFWLLNIYFIWRGTESIKWLEDFSAPILIVMGLVFIYWGYQHGGGFAEVLRMGEQMQKPTVVWMPNASNGEENATLRVKFNPLKHPDGRLKASEVQLAVSGEGEETSIGWQTIPASGLVEIPVQSLSGVEPTIKAQFRNSKGHTSSWVAAAPENANQGVPFWQYILWFTAMVGFWATMSISISDITRFAKSQKDQVAGQFIGLPGTMIFYSFVGIFVTAAALVAFEDVLTSEDAPWDPVSLVAKFQNPVVVVFAQVAMIIATLSTNIAANVIAPANAISNLFPQKISFRAGGVLAGVVGIALCPWWLMDQISSILVFVSGLLGPVLGILLCDYFVIRKKQLALADLYRTNGPFAYGGSGVNLAAIVALLVGVLVALSGYWIPALDFLYTLSWFTGFIVAFGVYFALMRNRNYA
ncbi:MAG: NCS1 family nucleobase:cation symporter-1 [Bacteroidetes Order II. Incertae sedis bacterium]|nr:NCS1 family nucleobase:cation symporter-1 [Bacteroidetes Order II. bacterium]